MEGDFFAKRKILGKRIEMSLYDLSPLEFTTEFDFVPDFIEPTTDRPNGHGVYSHYPRYEDPNYPNRICAPSAERDGCPLGNFVRSPYDINPLRNRIDDVRLVCPDKRPSVSVLRRSAACSHSHEDHEKKSCMESSFESLSPMAQWVVAIIVLLILVVLPAALGAAIGVAFMRARS